MRITKQIRSTVTRTRLLVAAISLLATEGFAATTMARVADVADVSAGPRQYYFPKSLMLFDAVVEHVLKFQETCFDRLDSSTNNREHIAQCLISVCNETRSTDNLAIIELSMACRGDSELGSLILDKIRVYEERAKARFLSLFEGSKMASAELLEIRLILVAASSRFATSDLEQTDDNIHESTTNLLTNVLADYIEQKSK